MRQNFRLLPPVLLCCLVALPLHAAGYQPVAQIAAAALAARDLGQGGQASVDPALKLARCRTPLQTRVQSAGTVEVSCSDAGWRVYVPVTVRNSRQVLVLQRPLAAGQQVVAEDLGHVQRDIGGHVQGLLVDAAHAIGRSARRPLQAGSLLAASDLHALRVVHRGQTVELVSRRGTVEIRVAARALRDGAVGDLIGAENLSTRRIVQGIVDADGTLRVR